MPNRNYNNGRSYEYKAKKELEEDGYQVIRASGSHGKWDLIAVPPDSAKVRCIQIKRTKAPGGVKQLLGKFQSEGGNYGTGTWASEMWVWYKGEWHKSGETVQNT